MAEIKKEKDNILKLVYSAIIAGALIGILELYIGHRLILDPLLYGNELNFVYESYLAPTYYGLAKSIITAFAFFFVYLFMPRNRLKACWVGIIGTIAFGIYYYFTFPRSSIAASSLIAVVHFAFIAGISYLAERGFKLGSPKKTQTKV